MKKSVLAGIVAILLFWITAPGARAQNGSLEFAGTEQYVDLAPNNPLALLTGDFTMDVWFYWRGGDPWQRIIGFGGSDRYFSLIPHAHPGVGGGIWFAMSNTVEGDQQLLFTATPISTNTWYHLAVTIEDATNTATMYLNGVQVAQETGFTLRPGNLTDLENFRFGRSNFFGDPYFNGFIDEIRFSNNLRYTGNFTPSNLPFTVDANTVALWGFNEGLGEVAGDASPNGYHGQVGSTNSIDPQDPSWSFFSTLPIKFTAFGAQHAAKGVKLKWTTSAIDNDADFEVEKSHNGFVFTAIGKLSVYQNQSSTSFEFEDHTTANDKVFYRIKLTELSKTSYSRIITWRPAATAFRLKRNVVANSLDIIIDNPGRFIITDVSGRTVQAFNLTGSSEVNITGLRSGMYFLTTVNGATLKFVKQ